MGRRGTVRRASRPTRATGTELLARVGAGPWRWDDAMRAGVSDGRLRGALASGVVRTVRPGQYVVADAIDAVPPRERFLVDVRAAVASTDGAVVSHRSALLIHGLPDAWSRGVEGVPEVVELTLRGSTGWRSTGLRVHGCPLPDAQIECVDGLPVTTPFRTALDVARGSPLPRALVGVDAVLRRDVLLRAGPGADARLVARDPRLRSAARACLDEVCEGMWGWPGIRAARAAAAAGDPGAESPLESMSRGHVLLDGLPAPEVGAPVTGDDGVRYWADLCWRKFGVIGEADGRLKYTDPERLYAEKRREDALRRAGWIVVRWTWEELIHRPEVVLQRIRAALWTRGWRP